MELSKWESNLFSRQPPTETNRYTSSWHHFAAKIEGGGWLGGWVVADMQNGMTQQKKRGKIQEEEMAKNEGTGRKPEPQTVRNSHQK